MNVPSLGLGDMSLRVQVRTVNCCTGVICCVKGGSAVPDDAITLEVQKKEGEELTQVEVSESSELIYACEKDGGCCLRQITSSDLPRFGKDKKLEELRKNTLDKYYQKLIDIYGSDIALIATLWQDIDFANMYTHTAPLQLSHVVTLHEGLRSIDRVQSTLKMIIRHCKKVAHEQEIVTIRTTARPEGRSLPVVSDTDAYGSEDELDLPQLDKVESAEVVNRQSKRRLEKSSLDGATMPGFRLEGVNSEGRHYRNTQAAFFEISKAKGLLSKEEAKIIGVKLGAAYKKTKSGSTLEDPKPLSELARVRDIMHLTREDSEKLLRLAICVSSASKKVMKKINRESNVDTKVVWSRANVQELLNQFAREPVPTTFSDSPGSNSMSRRRRRKTIDRELPVRGLEEKQESSSKDGQVQDARKKSESGKIHHREKEKKDESPETDVKRHRRVKQMKRSESQKSSLETVEELSHEMASVALEE